MTYDLAIIGGGPAGVAAGIYAARKRLKTIFITKDFEGQSSVSLDIQNWIGTVTISGADLASNLEKHLRSYEGEILDIKKGEWVQKLSKSSNLENPNGFTITTDAGSYDAHTVLITAGSRRRKLEVPGAAEYDNKGITYCASCDGPLFADMDVTVIGGGNAAFDTAAQLLAYCKTVTLLARGDFRADPATIEKTLQNPKFKAFKNTELVKISGDKFVSGLTYKNETGEIVEFPTKGVFAEIGSLPNTDFVKDFISLDKYNHIVTDPRNQRTSVEGVWAAGDVTDGLYQQNNIAAGDAIKALEDLYLKLHLTK